MIEYMIEMHKWTRNIPPPSTPKRYDPNEPSFDPNGFLGESDEEDLDE